MAESPSSFCRMIYSEVEEVGWEHLVKLGEDLTFLSFRVLDAKGRIHILEITLEKTYPKCPPSVAVDAPFNFNLEWTSKSKLKDVVQQFRDHVCKLEDFWSTVDDIDRSLRVTDPGHSHHAISYREIKAGNECSMIFCIDVSDPLSLPECRFLGSDAKTYFFKEIWKRNCKRWTKDKLFSENLASIFGTLLSQPPQTKDNEEQTECGICHARYLPIDEELGAKSGGATDYACENGNCKRAFHTACLSDWLRSVTTRQSFDVLFGNCPYCSDPVAVKICTNK